MVTRVDTAQFLQLRTRPIHSHSKFNTNPKRSGAFPFQASAFPGEWDWANHRKVRPTWGNRELWRPQAGAAAAQSWSPWWPATSTKRFRWSIFVSAGGSSVVQDTKVKVKQVKGAADEHKLVSGAAEAAGQAFTNREDKQEGQPQGRLWEG